MNARILIVGQCPDPHIEAVHKHLVGRGTDVTVLDRLRPEVHGLSYHYDTGTCRGALVVDGWTLDLADITAVWWRVKPFTIAELTGGAGALVGRFVDREWRAALDSLPEFTRSARWVNDRAADLNARNKPVQLAAAQRVGFEIPDTVVGNDPDIIVNFLEGDSGHIYKPLTWYVEPPAGLLFTSPTTAAEVRGATDAIRLAPGVFQRRIPKAYEVRATVIGERVFAVRIDSQRLSTTQLDWRRDQGKLDYAPLDLDPDVEDRLRQLQAALGLQFGAHDLIVTPAGEVVFLEVNPLGQWLWLEHATGLPIAAALADELSG